jgi:alkylation response protein AidB-like acyl-CoA dehydrogenase
MSYVLSEEQQLLKDSAKDLFKGAPVSLVRDLRDNGNTNGFSMDLWDEMVSMGWPSLAITEENGGLDFGIRGHGIVMEEAGRSLTNSPLVSLATSSYIIQKYGSAEQTSRLSDIAEGGNVIAIAIQEGIHYNPDQPASQAVKNGETWEISGTKTMVADAHVATHLIVNVKTENGLSIFLVPVDAPGVSISKDFLMDSRFYGEVHLSNVSVSDGNLIGEEGKGKKVISTITDVANALISAELFGLMSEAFERTVAYLKERRQFDQPIGSFQALQHRAAYMYSEIEIAKSLVLKALDGIDQSDFMTPALCSMAKAKCAKLSQLVTNEGVQMYGGIGMTDDEEIGFFMKRARVAAQQYGSFSYHVDRFATLSGY